MGYVRAGYEIDDIQTAIKALLDTKTSAPWSSWTVIRGWPEYAVMNNLAKPIIYVEHPVLNSAAAFQQGGGKSIKEWQMVIGAWDDRKTGGPEEIAIITSQLINLFSDAAVHTVTFTAAVGGTTYTSKTLLDWGIAIAPQAFSRDIATKDEKEFRNEVTLIIRT